MGGILAPCSHPTFILPRSEVLAPSIGCVIRPHIVKYHHPISLPVPQAKSGPDLKNYMNTLIQQHLQSTNTMYESITNVLV